MTAYIIRNFSYRFENATKIGGESEKNDIILQDLKKN